MADFTYGCNNRARPVADKPLLVQDGYFGTYDPKYAAVTRIPRWVTVPYTMSTECRYDASTTDSACKGCAHAPHLRK